MSDKSGEVSVVRRMTPAGVRKLMEWEGFKRSAYRDSAGFMTIGVGHLLTQVERERGTILLDIGERLDKAVVWTRGLTETEVMQLLAQDLYRFEKAVTNAVPMSISDREFDSLVSFAFNVGVGSFLSSTLLKRIKNGKRKSVPTEFRKWNIAGGKVVDGLKNRREYEIAWGEWEQEGSV